MRTRSHASLAVLLLLTAGSLPASAEQATAAEAWTVAQKYIELLIYRVESWGDYESATVTGIEEFRRGERLLGYVAHVEPEGYLVVSAQKGLAAVKAHSPEGRFVPRAEGGIATLLADLMESAQVSGELRSGKELHAMTAADWSAIGATDRRPVWSQLTAADFNAASVTRPLPQPVGAAALGYQEHEFLVTSTWHQSDPYNRQTPPGETCSGWPPVCVPCDHTKVGCVATAGAQIMRYWSWPPAAADDTYADHYRWSSMPDVATANSSQEEIDAVSAASWRLGEALNMDYGCDESGSNTYDMEAVLQNRRYDSGCTVVDRYFGLGLGFTPAEWFQLIKNELNINRPVQYKVDGHSIIADGWYELEVGGTLERWYHMNYGWGGGSTIWYLMDDIPLGNPPEEYIVGGIRPDVDMGATMTGTYSLPTDPGVHFDKPTRYFDQNASGANASFAAGHNFQFARPGVWLRNTGTGSDEILFQGTPGAQTEFYKDAPVGDVKIRITDGVIRMKAGGEIALH